MIIASKQSQVEAIKKYIESNSDIYNKCIIFGKCTTPKGTSNDYLGVAVQTVDNSMADNDDALLELFCAIDDITEGLFDMIILNSRNVLNNKEIEKGELVYG